MQDLLDYAFGDCSLELPRRRSRIEAPRKQEPLFESEDALVSDLLRALHAPADFSADALLEHADFLANKQQLRVRMDQYVNRLLAHPEWTYATIRQELQMFADSCEPPISHMQARAIAYIEKRKRAQQGDASARHNLSSHQRRKWRLSDAAEEYLWLWITDRWASKDKNKCKRDHLAQELMTMSENLGIPKPQIELWIRTTITAIAKMQHGRVKITGWPVQLVVRAAMDDTDPDM